LQKNLKTIRKLNKADSGATFGVTQFADLTREEFRQILLKHDSLQGIAKHPNTVSVPEILERLPDSFDWFAVAIELSLTL